MCTSCVHVSGSGLLQLLPMHLLLTPAPRPLSALRCCTTQFEKDHDWKQYKQEAHDIRHDYEHSKDYSYEKVSKTLTYT